MIITFVVMCTHLSDLPRCYLRETSGTNKRSTRSAAIYNARRVCVNRLSNCLNLPNGLLYRCGKGLSPDWSLAGICTKKGLRGRSLDHGNRYTAAGPEPNPRHSNRTYVILTAPTSSTWKRLYCSHRLH